MLRQWRYWQSLRGVTGTAGFLSGVGADPVTAQEIIVDGIERLPNDEGISHIEKRVRNMAVSRVRVIRISTQF